METNKKIKYNFSVDELLIESLKQHSDGRPMSVMISRAIEHYLKHLDEISNQ